MRFAEFPFLRYVIFLILGILMYSRICNWPPSIFFYPLLISYSFYISLIFINHNKEQFRFRVAIPVLAYFQLFLLGIVFNYFKDIRQDANNLINDKHRIESYLALVLGHDEPKPNSMSNRVSLKMIFDGLSWRDTEGEVLFYHRSELKLIPGDLVWVKGSPQQIGPASNPYEFDYRNFMLNQQISHQHFVLDQIAIVGSLEEFPLESFFIDLRAGVMDQIDKWFVDTKSNQIAKALLLGQKKSLEKEVSEAYATAGAMHVLAVSGLHVGIIYGFFFLFLKPYRLPLRYRVLYLSILIGVIWAYALLTGMSPSVMRAATMFSLMALAQMKSRNPSIYNAIALSAMILLVFDPFLIYAVGFQLSYIALLGIILIQPLLVRLWLPKQRITEYIWQISTVGIAAQLATFPISAYYFHSFPVYFLLSNLVAIPGAFLIMSLGVPFMLFSSVPFLGSSLALLTEKFISIVNHLIFWIQKMPFSKVSEIYISPLYVGLYFLILGLLILFLLNPNKKLIYSIVIVLTGIGFFRLYFKFDDFSKNEVILYGLDKGIAIDVFIKGDLYTYEDVAIQDLGYKVQPNRDNANPNSYWPLWAFQSKENLLIYLPGNLGHMTIGSHQKVSLNNSLIGRYYYWDEYEGKWRDDSLKGPIQLNGTAHKIALK